MKTMEENSVDLIVTSPPYNCGMNYGIHNDSMPWDDYLSWCQKWIDQCYRVCKKDGRIAINVLIEMGVEDNSVRVSPLVDYVTMIKKSGFKIMGLPAWTDNHRVKNSAWGSWLSASSPYIYNPYEIVILSYKESKKKQGETSTISKEDFIEGTSGVWGFHPETRGLTKCCFPVELPELVINLLSFENDLVLDPFSGSGSTGIACIKTNRRYVGIEKNPNYCDISKWRVEKFGTQETLF